MSLIDSHAHLTSQTVFDNVDLLLERAMQAGIEAIINVCTDLQSLERGLALSKRCPWVYQAAATTPHDVEKEGEEVFNNIAASAHRGELKAIGETGLDYFYEHSNRAIQQHFLRRYLNLALETRLPIIIHCREAFDDLFTIIDEEYRVDGNYGPGVLHCFTGTAAEAEGVLKRGWMLSLSGIVTFKKSTNLQCIAKEVPLDQLLIETDTPFLAPQKQRGKLNEPAFLVETATYISSLKGISLEKLAFATSANTRRLFALGN